MLFEIDRPSDAKLMIAMDAVNDRFGKKTLVVGSEGVRRSFETKAEMRTPKLYDEAFRRARGQGVK